MLSKDDIKILSAIIDELIDNKDSEPFRTPVDYKGIDFSSPLLPSTQPPSPIC